MSNPEFLMFCGPMFSTKTSMLILMLEKYRHQKKRCVVFKPNLDDRYSKSEVVSHGGATVTSVVVKDGSDIFEYLSNLDEQPHVVAVDEAFMIPGCAEALIYLYRLGISVVVSTLDISAAGKPFEEPLKMMPWATQVHKLTSVCVVCGANAHYTHKKTTGGDEIEVGGGEIYEPRCFSHHAIVNNRIGK